MSKWDEKKFQEWLVLREKYRAFKREKDWEGLIAVCQLIIELDSEAKFISIMTPLFYKDMAKAFQKLGQNNQALKYYQMAKERFLKYRAENKLNQPDDWLKDISIIEKKILKLTE